MIPSEGSVARVLLKRIFGERSESDLYTGTLWGLPDRGFNVLGTINYQPRVHKFTITFNASAPKTGSANLQLEYKESVFLSDPTGIPFTGLDPDPVRGYLFFPGFPPLPGRTTREMGLATTAPAVLASPSTQKVLS